MNTRKHPRRMSSLLAIMLAVVLTVNCLVLPSMALQTEETAELTVHTDDSTEQVSQTASGVVSADAALPEGAVKIGEDESYNYYQITDADAIAALLERYDAAPEAASAPYYEVEDEAVTAIVQVDGSAPLVENAALGIRLGAQADALGVATAQSELIAQQNAVYATICDALGEDVELTGNYTVLTNSFAVEVMASQISEIAKLPGVKSCYVAPKFYAMPASVYDDLDTSVVPYDGTGVQVGADKAWERGYTGEGMVIGIIDTGIRVTHNAFATDPETQSLTYEDVQDALANYNLQAEEYYSGTLTADDLYYSGKIAYMFDYSESDTDVEHGGAGAHGTHVAGIAAGCDTTSDYTEGGFATKGTAYDAQLAVFKVFSADSASFDDIVAAMEDAILLGLDAVNLSLGSAAGGTYDDGVTQIFENALTAGVNVLCAAGNEGVSSTGNRFGFNQNLTKNPDNAMGSIPGNYAPNLSVASANSESYPLNYNHWWGTYASYGNPEPYTGALHECCFYDFAPLPEDRLTYRYGGDKFPVVAIPGYGTEESIAEYLAAQQLESLDGLAVLVEEDYFGATEDDEGNRITSQEVYDNLKAAGAEIIFLCADYDSDEDIPVDTEVDYEDGYTVPMVFCEWLDYTLFTEYCAEHPDEDVKITIPDYYVPVDDAGQISFFSSWGTTNDLTIKPEITAIGGYVYSAYDRGYDNDWDVLSGTSMATPQVAGAVAVVRQYLETVYPTLLEGMTSEEISELINSVLMSTADPILYQSSTDYWSVRAQGAGLIDLDQATATDAYLTNTDDSRPKGELGDDPEKTGVYTVKFTIHNLSSDAKTYTLDAVVQTEDYASDRLSQYVTSEYRYFMSGRPTELDATVNAPESVNVPANGSATVSVEITLSDSAKAWLNQYYSLGGYVEGFVFATDENGETLSLPYLAYYGDWTDPTIMDNTFYYNALEGEWQDESSVHMNSVIVKEADGSYNYLGNGIGFNANNLDVAPRGYHTALNYISPNGDGSRDGIEGIYIGQLRYAENISYTITDNDTGAVYYEKEMEGVSKNYVDSTGKIIPTGADAYTLFDPWYGTDANGKTLPNNTSVTIRIAFTTNFNGEQKEEVWEIPVTIDTQMPEVTPIANKSSDSMELYLTENKALCRELFVESYIGSDNKVYTVKSTQTVVPPPSNIGIYANGSEEPQVGLTFPNALVEASYIVWDYAGNCTAVVITPADHVKLTEKSVNLTVGESVQLHNTGVSPVEDDALTWTSMNTKVATVAWDADNEDVATVTGVSAGKTRIKVSRVAHFQKNYYVDVNVYAGIATVTASAGEGGSISNAGESTVNYGAGKTYTITPDEHYVIKDVLVDGKSVGAVSSYTFTNQDTGRSTHTITATFALETFTVNFLDWDDTNLSTQSVAYGTAAQAPANPTRANYTFLCWDTDFSRITADTNVKAVYVKNDVTVYYTLVAIRSTGGSIEGPSQVTAGENATFKITPDEGYEIGTVYVDGQSVGAVDSYTFENVQSGHYIQVEFREVTPDVPEKPDEPVTPPEKKFPFTDVTENDWFYDEVRYVYENDLMNGVATTLFAPEEATTRGMIVTILARMEGVNTAGSQPWYEAGRAWAMKNNVSDGTNMDDQCTREQLVTMLYRYAVLKGCDVSKTGAIDGFTDAAQVSYWAVDAMRWAVGSGLVQGSDGKLTPQENATRAQVATMIMRFDSLLKR